jgi:NAD(P) transhydrogenase subunit alpha
VEAHGVHVLGPVNLPSTVPFHASQTYSRNLHAFLALAAKGGSLVVDLEDEIQGAMALTHGGEARQR